MKKSRKTIGLICVLTLIACTRGNFSEPSSAAEACMDWGFFDPNIPDNQVHRGSLRPWYAESSGFMGTWEENKPLIDRTFAAGQRPFITWEFWNGANDGTNPFPLRDISAGHFDKYLDSWANGVAKYAPRMVYLRIFHEMNDPYATSQGQGYPWSVAPDNEFGNAPKDLADAWRHIHSRFAAAGATNAKWVFNSDNDLINNPIPAETYPGDSYVDFTGWDAYEPADVESDYREMAAISGKPMVIGETNAARASYVRSLEDGIKSGRWPQLKMMVVFNDLEWSLNRHPRVEQAYTQLFKQTLFCRP